MPRIVPSQVVEAIDVLLPFAKNPPKGGIKLGSEYAPRLLGVVQLARDIPPELIQLSGADYSEFVVAIAALDHMVQLWVVRGGVDVPQKIFDAHPIMLLRRALAKCPDQVPSPSTATLGFISDTNLRESIRNDMSAASADLHAGEWKGATVLAGSAAEALLLWAIQERGDKSKMASAVATIPASRRADPELWALGEYIQVAETLGLIKSDTATQARLAKDFRNLIHPGRAARLQQVCDRGTALSALAAVELIARDLQC